jgi:hypothetical protein
VTLMSLNSFLVGNFSDTKMRVPSERTTRSRGEIRNANGRAIHSMIRNAMYVSGVTPPLTPLTWFFDKLRRLASPYVRPCTYSINLLDSTSNQLAEITSNNPECQILSTRTRWRKRHDSTRLGDVPSSSPNSSEEASKNEVPLVAELRVTIV